MYTEKSVFICHRRGINTYIARAVYHHLNAQGCDAFMDAQPLDSGKLDPAVLNQIAARTHFLTILTLAGVERCNDLRDWMRREIEYALDMRRNIIVLQVGDFSFDGSEQHMRGKLQRLRQFPTVRLFHEKLEEALPQLNQALAQPLPVPIHRSVVPAPEEDRVNAWIARAAAQPQPTKRELRAEAFFDRGSTHRRMGDREEALANLDKAIGLNSEYALAYTVRASVLRAKGELELALRDVNRAIEIDPAYVGAYNNRAVIYDRLGRYQDAINDYSEAIRLNPDYDKPYINRGEAYFVLGEYEKALTDFRKANDLKPGYYAILAGLAITYHALGNLTDAKRLWSLLLGLNVNYRDAAWVKKQLMWDDVLAAEAQKLIAAM